MQHPTLSSNNSTNPKTTYANRIQTITTKITAPKADDYTIDYYDHNIIRPNDDLFLNNDQLLAPN